MISIIICSINTSLLADVKKNILDTIGAEYEIIAIDNLQANRGICSVYNQGVEKAKYPILCFLHEDIQIKTNNWGIRVTEVFKDDKIGLLGIAGSTYRSATPSGWFPPSEFEKTTWRLNINQGSKYKDKVEQHEYYNPKREKLSKVSCIDGVWFCTTKKIAQTIKFDEHLLKGFHGYDIDFSLAVGKKYDILVSYEILLSHASDGNFNHQWLKEIIKVQDKYDEILPIDYEGYSKMAIKKLEYSSLKRYLNEVIKNEKFMVKDVKQILKVKYLQDRLSLFNYLKFSYKLTKLKRTL